MKEDQVIQQPITEHELYVSVGLKTPMKPSEFSDLVDSLLVENVSMQSWGVHTTHQYIGIIDEQHSTIQQLREETQQSRAELDIAYSANQQQTKVLERLRANDGRNADLVQQLREERDKYRTEAIQERELTVDIVGEREQLIIDNEKLIAFAKEVIQTSWDGGGLDGGDIQDLGVKHGLLTEEFYDPEKHGENFAGDFELGDLIYMYSDVVLPKAIDSTEPHNEVEAEGQAL